MPNPTALSTRFAEELTKKFQAMHPQSYSTNTVTAKAGAKFDKLIIAQANGQGQRFVHVFIDRETGDLIKAAGWAKPQRGKYGFAIRYNLVTDFDFALEAADPYGSYLYEGAIGR